jgi:hypothetical protein
LKRGFGYFLEVYKELQVDFYDLKTALAGSKNTSSRWLDKVEEGSMKNLTNFLKIITIGVIILIGLAGCESTDWAVVANSLNSANNSFANAYSSSSESGMTYYFYNRSSEWVTIWDDTGEKDIPPNGSVVARFNKYATINDVYYSPPSVRVTQSGYSFTFTN